MSRYAVLATINQGTVREYRKGQVAELTAAQVAALGAGNFRQLAAPANVITTTWQSPNNSPIVSTSTLSTPPGSETHDINGEGIGCSN